MNNIFQYGSIEAIPLYNCSEFTPEQWTEKDGVRRPIAGIIEITYGIFINILYIPTIFVMFKKELFKMSCFKIMISLGIVDMLALWFSSIISGFLAFRGAVYCTYPNLIYISGMLGLGLWCSSCVTAMILVINRLIDLTNPDLAKFFSKGNRTYLVISASIIYGMYFVFFTHPPIFSSKYHAWFFDPAIFENRSQEYANIAHGLNNFFVVTFTCLLYVSLCFVIKKQMRDARFCSKFSSKSRKMSIQIFLQSAMICAINQIASIVYVLMNFIEVPIWLTMLGHVLWQFGHGAPVLIYLCLNKTIRSGLLEQLGLLDKKSPNVVPIVVQGFGKNY